VRLGYVLALGSAFALSAVAANAQPPQGVVLDPGASGVQGKPHDPRLELGYSLYAANCVSCHGPGGKGVPQPVSGAGGVRGQGPPLRGVGAGTADFYLRTGYMPLGEPDEQPQRRPLLFGEREIRALVAYVASLGSGPRVPQPHPERGSLSEGLKLFTSHCAGCHQVVVRGGYLTDLRVPPLTKATPVQIAEAVRAGPYVMPRFTEKAISDAQLDSIIRYVRYASRGAEHPGGWSIGFIGPIPEGLVTWFLGASALVAACVVIGTRLRT
jgi:quinol---cytochrome-c reductase cytochrome c subunit